MPPASWVAARRRRGHGRRRRCAPRRGLRAAVRRNGGTQCVAADAAAGRGRRAARRRWTAAHRRLGRRSRRRGSGRVRAGRQRRALPVLLPDGDGLGADGGRPCSRRGTAAAALPAPARRQAAGRQVDCESPAMRYATEAPLDPKNLSLLWASPERVERHRRAARPPFRSAVGRREHRPVDRASRRRGLRRPGARAEIVGRLRHRPDRGRRGRDPVGGRGARVAAPRHRPQMIEGLVRAARRAEVKRLFLEVAADNTAAIRLYKGLGFDGRWPAQGLLPAPGRPAGRRGRPRARRFKRPAPGQAAGGRAATRPHIKR